MKTKSTINKFAWNELYIQNKQLSTWPFTDIIKLYKRFAVPHESHRNVLELGVGFGANIPFFMSLDCNYYGIEGSEYAISELAKRFENLIPQLHNGNFTTEIPFDQLFDVVIDRASVTHNDTESIRRCLSLIKNKIRRQGLFIGVDWFSIENQESSAGNIVDANTRNNYDAGKFVGMGNVHFSDIKHIVSLFAEIEMEIIYLEHKKVETFIGEKTIQGYYNFVARKL